MHKWLMEITASSRKRPRFVWRRLAADLIMSDSCRSVKLDAQRDASSGAYCWKQNGIKTTQLSNIDRLDAAFCALTAHRLLGGVDGERPRLPASLELIHGRCRTRAEHQSADARRCSIAI